MRRGLAVLFAVALLPGALLLPAARSRAQEPGEQATGAGRRAFAGMQRVSGEVTAVSGANVTVKTVDGATVQVVTTANTRLMKAGGAALTMSEVKVGDGVMAAGNLDAPHKTMHAAMLFWTDGAEVRRMKANLGKTYIAGRVTAIDADNAKMTVKRPDGVEQMIGFDETTSFRRGRPGRVSMGMGEDTAGRKSSAPTGESITLADIKVGDSVSGAGSLKQGVFVPTELVVATPREHHESAGQAAPAAGATAPQ